MYFFQEFFKNSYIVEHLFAEYLFLQSTSSGCFCIIVCSEIPFSKNQHRAETSQLIYSAVFQK